MAIDYNVLLFDPVYAELGVPATLVPAGTAGEIAITVIDETRRKPQPTFGVEVLAIGPAACARIPELTANGIVQDDYDGSSLTFNGRTWIVQSHDRLGSPNGEDLGLVRFFLMANE